MKEPSVESQERVRLEEPAVHAHQLQQRRPLGVCARARRVCARTFVRACRLCVPFLRAVCALYMRACVRACVRVGGDREDGMMIDMFR